MDIKTLMHPQDVPDTRKGSTPSTPSEGHPGTHGYQYRLQGTGYAPRSGQPPGPYLNGAQPARPHLHPHSQNAQPQSPATGNGQAHAYQDHHQQQNQQQASWAGWDKTRESSGRSHEEAHQDKPNQAPYVKAHHSHVQHVNGTTNGNGSHTHQPVHQTTTQTYTPTGSSPGSAHSSFPRPSSSHSTSTPTSSHFQQQGYPQHSPGAQEGVAHAPSYPQYSQYPPQQPHTPLGPPPSKFQGNFTRDSPTSYAYERTSSFGSDGHIPPNFNPSSLAGRPQHYGVSQGHPSGHSHVDARLREQSMSVSPKTKTEPLPTAPLPPNGSPSQYAPMEKQNSLKRKASDMSHSSTNTLEEQGRPKAKRASSMNIGSFLNDAPPPQRIARNPEPVFSPSRSSSTAVESPGNLERTPIILEDTEPHVPQPSPSKPIPGDRGAAGQASRQSPPSMPQRDSSHNLNHASQPLSLDEKVSISATAEPRPAGLRRAWMQSPVDNPAVRKQPVDPKTPPPPPLNQAGSAATSVRSKTASPVVTKKPPRMHAPIFAQSFRKWRHANGDRQLSTQPISHHAIMNGHTSAKQPADDASQALRQAQKAPTPAPEHGPLGPWEPSILNIIPNEQIVKVVSDFLFEQVVIQEAIGVGPAGGKASEGAMLEIEAKLGRLIDRNTNDRLKLPVATECVVSKDDPNLRLAFESQMTEAQHRSLNNFLNDALVNSKANKTGSQPSSKPRVPMDYRHTREIDTFYELSPQGVQALPPSVTNGFPNHHRSRTHVRITTDQKTGAELARIIKTRVADIDIYCPKDLFDYRISVNVEANYAGGMHDLVKPDRRERGAKQDRHKDRLSYRHLAYQIDLTQVTPNEDGQQKSIEKDHELEIEVSSEEIRRQGNLARNGADHGYEELVRGFLDNVRVLGRHCQS